MVDRSNFTGVLSDPQIQTGRIQQQSQDSNVRRTFRDFETLINLSKQGNIKTLGEDLRAVEGQAARGQAVLDQATADLQDDTSIGNVRNVFSRVESLREGEIQGAISPGEASARAEALFRNAVIKNPQLSTQFEQVFRSFGFGGSAGSGGGGRLSPELSAAQDAVAELTETSIKSGIPIERLVENNALKAEAERADSLVKIAANEGRLTAPFLTASVGQQADNVLTELSTIALSQVRSGALSVEDFKARAELEFATVQSNFEQTVADSAAKGVIFGDNELKAVRDRISNTKRIVDRIMETSDPLAVLTRLNELSSARSTRSVQDFFAEFGFTGELLNNVSPDNQLNLLLGALQFAEQAKRPGALVALERLAANDPQIASMLGLLRADKGNGILNRFAVSAGRGDLNGSEVENRITESLFNNSLKSGQGFLFGSNGERVDIDGGTLDAAVKLLKNPTASSTTTNILVDPKTISQVRRNKVLRDSLNEAVDARTPLLLSQVRQLGDATRVDFNKEEGSFKVIRETLRPSRAGTERIVDVEHDDLSDQLTDIYQFKLSVFGNIGTEQFLSLFGDIEGNLKTFEQKRLEREEQENNE